MKVFKKCLNNLSYIIIFSIFFTSCVNTKNATYFNNLTDTTFQSVFPLESIIQNNDILNISVSSLNPEASLIFNTPNTSNISTWGTNSQLSGYLVNSDGTIQFPLLGTITASGLTKNQLKEAITTKLVSNKLLVDPIVNIRFLNYHVTVLGEVANPTTLTVSSEKISLLEAIGLAGDFTIYAKRNNVMVIRNVEGKKIVKRLNLNTNELFTSPYYYLKSDDVVYVEPNKAKVASASNTQQWLPIIFSGLSFLAIILTNYWKK